MTKLVLRYYPDPVLKEQTAPVEQFDAELAQLLDDMAETMYAEHGIGLAAPQVGILKQITVIDLQEEEHHHHEEGCCDGHHSHSHRIELINPEIIQRSGKVSSEEGCLSIPGFRETIKRSEQVIVRAQDRHGEQYEIEAEGLLAFCLQHEIDHLNGILFLDHLSRLKRDLFRAWWKKNWPEGVVA